MAGSYGHVTNSYGELRQPGGTFEDMVENLGDAYEAIEEMYGMIWWLADRLEQHEAFTESQDWVEIACKNYQIGLERSAGAEVMP